MLELLRSLLLPRRSMGRGGACECLQSTTQSSILIRSAARPPCVMSGSMKCSFARTVVVVSLPLRIIPSFDFECGEVVIDVLPARVETAFGGPCCTLPRIVCLSQHNNACQHGTLLW